MRQSPTTALSRAFLQVPFWGRAEGIQIFSAAKLVCPVAVRAAHRLNDFGYTSLAARAHIRVLNSAVVMRSQSQTAE